MMITEIEAAKHFIKLSDEEIVNLNVIKKKKKIQEIFGEENDDGIVDQDQCKKEVVIMKVMTSKMKKKKKARKFRTLESIYMETRPIRYHLFVQTISYAVLFVLQPPPPPIQTSDTQNPTVPAVFTRFIPMSIETKYNVQRHFY
ncbi:unnamed protein product [Cochlearia groenlandica]